MDLHSPELQTGVATCPNEYFACGIFAANSIPDISVMTIQRGPKTSDLTFVLSSNIAIACVLLLLSLVFLWRQIKEASRTVEATQSPSKNPHSLSMVKGSILFLWDPVRLARTITNTFGMSGVTRLNLFTKDVYVVTGADYLNAIWKKTRELGSTNGINIALSNMFKTPKKDMEFFEADKSGITHDPHSLSNTRPDDRVFYLMHKATVDCLAGSHLTIAAIKFEAALAKNIAATSVSQDWIELDDLFGFLRPLVSKSTVQAMCGNKFVERFPDFIDDFWNFNTQMPKLLKGWPRWLMPKAWTSRDRCIATMKQWRELAQDDSDFDGNAMIPRRWGYFEKMKDLSKEAVACSDLGILWGMNSNSMPATYWLIWHLFNDRDMLHQAASETQACRLEKLAGVISFDTNKLCAQHFLQSSYAETLRKYVAVYVIRQPDHEDVDLLDVRIPRGKMMVIPSGIAHMDPKSWASGKNAIYPVDGFHPKRFLTSQQSTDNTPAGTPSVTRPHLTRDTSFFSSRPGDRFSLNSYSGSWIPFGGGIHQCPGRHWVKLQMLLTFAMLEAHFDIEPLQGQQASSVDLRKWGLGAMQPAAKVPFRIRRKP